MTKETIAVHLVATFTRRDRAHLVRKKRAAILQSLIPSNTPPRHRMAGRPTPIARAGAAWRHDTVEHTANDGIASEHTKHSPTIVNNNVFISVLHSRARLRPKVVDQFSSQSASSCTSSVETHETLRPYSKNSLSPDPFPQAGRGIGAAASSLRAPPAAATSVAGCADKPPRQI
jgi:hypothetical protein